MKAVVIYHAGGPQVLKLVNLPKPKLKAGWSRIKVKGFGINHSEIFTRQGLSPTVHFPRVLGIEAVGVIDATTSSAHPIGQKVVTLMGGMGRAFNGGYAEYTLVPNQQIYPVHVNYSWADLAAIPETFYTAFGIFRSLQIKPNDKILVRPVTSGVGVSFLKLVKALPFKTTVVGTTRSHNKTSQLSKLGLNRVLVTSNPNYLNTDMSFNEIVDLIGPTATQDSLKHLKPFGIISSTGQLGGKWTLDHFDPIFNIPNNRYLTGFYSGKVTNQQVQKMFHYLRSRHVDVSPEKIYPMDKIQQAHEYLESGRSLGKVVVLP